MKIIGMIMILLSCTLIGTGISLNLKKRITLLQSISFCLEEVCNEVEFGKNILMDIFYNVSRKSDGTISDFFVYIYKELSDEEDNFYEIWNKGIEIIDKSVIKKEEKEMLYELGIHIINTNQDRLCEVIKGYVQRFNSLRNNLEEEYRQKAKMYQSVGFLAGVFLVIVLI